jgi:hypothetical protein
MSNKKKFKKGDVYNNTIVAYPEYEFYVHNSKTYINRESEKAGDFSNKVNHVDQGFISLHEININRPATSLVYPFITKDGARTAFSTVTTSNFQDASQFNFGDTITGTYPLSASVNRVYVQSYETDNKKFLRSLYNPVESGGHLSPYFNHTTMNATDVNIIEVPSIFYGSSVRKGSVQLDYYYTGSLIGQLKDTKKNGELRETIGAQSGSVAGVILYDYGICLLTASYNITSDSNVQDKYFDAGTNSLPSWLSFGSGMMESQGKTAATLSGEAVGANPSYLIKLQGTNKIPTLTMMATANKGELNYSNNPTFISYHNSGSSSISSGSYSESNSKIVNIAKSKYTGYQEEFEKIVYISKIGIYDEYGNLLGIASLANPVKKAEAQDYLFKLRLDF